MASDQENLRSSRQPKVLDSRAQATAEGGRSLLDLRTQLVKPDRRLVQTVGWKFNSWPGCAEASVSIVTSGSSRASFGRNRVKNDDEVAELWQMANGRAGSRSRRFFVLNRLRYMWVLTFADARRDRRLVMSEVADFARRLRALNGGENFPYWYSPELHPGGHGWHVNFFISFRVEHAQVELLWGQGFVWVTDFTTALKGPKGEPLGMCRTPREGLRRAAHYGCKYAQKDWSPEHVGAANHRYEVAQGFAPKSESQWIVAPIESEQLVGELVPDGEWSNVRRWDSNDDPEWTRPPIRTWRW